MSTLASCSRIFSRIAASDGETRSLVLNEITQTGFLVVADGRFERDGQLRDFLCLADLFDGDVHALGDFFNGRLAAEFLDKLAACAHLFIDGFDHVHGDANRPGLIRDGASDRLADPPRGIGRELVAAAPFEFVRAAHEADVAFLNQIEEMQAAVRIFLGDRYNQTKIGFGQFPLRLFGQRLHRA